MTKFFLPLLLVLSFAFSNVSAGQGPTDGDKQEKPEPYPALEIQRPFLIPPASFEIRSEFSYLSTTHGFNDNGKDQKLDKNWNVFSAQLKFGYGVFKWWEVGAGLPYYSGNEMYAEGQSIGDLYIFNNFKVYETKKKDKELAGTFRASFPTGEYNRLMTIVNSNYVPETLRTGDPGIDLYPGVLARWTFKNMALRANAEYGYRFPGKIKYGIEALETSTEFDPGESLTAGVDFLYQIHSKFVILAGLGYFMQDSNKLKGESLHDAEYFLGFLPGLEFQPAPDYDIYLKTCVPLAGKNYPNGYPIILGVNTRF